MSPSSAPKVGADHQPDSDRRPDSDHRSDADRRSSADARISAASARPDTGIVGGPIELVLPVEGMTCASCVNRIERFLRKTDGVVEASVNLVTERATVQVDPSRAGRDDLVRAIEAAGYDVPRIAEPAATVAATDTTADGATPAATRTDAEAEREVARQQEQRRIGIAALVSLIVSAGIMGLMTFGDRLGLGMEDVNRLVIWPATFIQFWAGGRFLSTAWRAGRHGSVTMDTLVAVGTLAAWGSSAFVTTWPELVHRAGLMPQTWFDSSTVIIGLILTGRWLELRARGRTRGAVQALMRLQAPVALRVTERDGVTREEQVAIREVQPGDLLRVRAGESVPVDGTVTEGTSAVDESMLTGEAMPVVRGPGDAVIGGSINTTGSFLMHATRVGSDTVLARIVRMVEAAQGSRAPIQRLADAVSARFVPLVILLAAITFGIWAALGPQPTLAHALVAAVSVLIIACPCAMGLATPTAIMVGTGRAAEAGILIRGGAALEAAGRVDTVVFDKTGTLTLGRPEVVGITPADGLGATDPAEPTDPTGPTPLDEAGLLSLAAAAERGSDHPLARAITAAAETRGVPVPPATDLDAVPGGGVLATVDGARIVAGTRRFLSAQGIDAPEPDGSVPATNVLVARDGRYVGVIAIADPVRAEAAEAVAAFRRMGIEVWLVTGDGASVAHDVARRVGIEHVLAEVLPEDKLGRVQELQAAGRKVAMVGDGINDAPALAGADVGIAIGSGADVAIEASDITLVGGDPRLAVSAIELSRRTLRVIRENLFWAFGYNVLLIPVAMGVLYPFTGITLDPALAAGAMAISSVSVVLNSLRLRRVDVRPGTPGGRSVTRLSQDVSMRSG